ncbi:MAG: DUF58 domain-containing protein [Xenococcaceae cyanobacterium MO_167.B27]|nr:DUF58 domain-containing protein [Xenococcaceae cyanobacterium MO_167.B27]
MIVPSLRCYLLLLLSLPLTAILAIFINNQASIITTIIYDLIILILALWDGIRVRRNKVKITRKPLGKLSVGKDNHVTLEVTTQQPAIIQVKDNYPQEFPVSKDSLQAVLPSNTRETLTYNIHPNSRGKYTWGDIQIRQLGNWGLAWSRWKVAAKQPVVVYPDLIGLRSLTIRLTLENTGMMRRARRIGNGTEFAELREYSQGDDIRLIDWKATARKNRPLIKVLEPEQEQTLFILLDRGRLMTAQVQGLKRFDWGINATLSLALAGLSRGDKVGVAVFDRDVTTWIPPERGQSHLSKLIESLTLLQPVLLEPDYLGAVTKVVTQQTRRALVVVITDIIDVTASTELLGAMMKLTPRYLPFCVTLGDTKVDTIAHTTTDNIKDAYCRAVALDLLSQRQTAFASLKQKGVLVLDAPCDKISEELVDRYLNLKGRSLL